LIAMTSLRICAGVAVVVAVLCSSGRHGANAGAGGAGAVTGRVHVVAHSARRLATAGVYPGRIVGIQSERDTSELDNVVVFVNSSVRVDTPPRHVTIRQTNEEFVPHVVAVTAGSTVEFPNDDLIFHNVFSLSRAATFDLGRYPRNTSKGRTFTKPGVVKVFCHLHSHMSAIVRVFSHPYFASPDRSGRFTIPDVPAGRVEVTAWHERAGEVTHTATVEAGGKAELSFSLPLTDPE
jgi:plastocyanin